MTLLNMTRALTIDKNKMLCSFVFVSPEEDLNTDQKDMIFF